MAKVKKITRAQQYQKELEKLNKRILTQEKKGYIVSRETLKELLPKEKKRYSIKDIEKVKNIKAKQIKESATEFVDITTGEVFPTSEAKRIIKEQKEIFKQAQVNEDYIPSFDYVSAVIGLIDNLPDSVQAYESKHFGEKELSSDKMMLKSIIYDTMADYESEEAYNDYLGSVFAEIQEELTIIVYDSNGDTIELAISNVINLISNRMMTMGEAQRLSDLSELLV